MAHVLFLCNDLIGDRMAGPAIRYVELSRHLAGRYDVVLAARQRPSLTVEGVRLVGWDHEGVGRLVREADVCFTQLVWPRVGRAARSAGTHIVLDCYDPFLIEELESQSGRDGRVQKAKNRRTLAKTTMSLTAADALVCANERQRDLWLGALMALGRVTPEAYMQDRSLSQLVSIVPFGLPDEAPVRGSRSIRQELGLTRDATLLVWGGGVWNWFDPLTLIESLDAVVARGRDVHLVFLGLRHPNPHVPEADMARQALAKAEQLGLLNRHVHANLAWTPYEARADVLLDADIGVSTHFEHLETHFSFRTRMLDYLWAGLPMITTEGDGFAELVASKNLGFAVPAGDARALTDAILRLADDRQLRLNIGERVLEVAQDFRWSAVADSLAASIDGVLSRPLRGSFSNAEMIRYLAATANEIMVERRWREAATRLVHLRPAP